MDDKIKICLLSDSQIRLWLLLFNCPKLGIKALTRIDAILPSPIDIFTLPKSEWSGFKLTSQQISFLSKPNWTVIDQIVNWMRAQNVTILPFNHPLYASLLLETSSPAVLLFVKGNLGLLNQAQVAFVGSRNPTAYGCQVTKDLITNLVCEHRVIITSGLAIGIDGIAHKSTLDCQGHTVAVLGSGLNNIYPKRHLYLAEQIVEQQGLLVSEFLPDVPPIQFNFPKRNRIIAGLSNGTVVVEAAIKSGSLITAQCALEEGRDVFAVPGSVFNSLSDGCHHLIKQGAKLITKADDIVEEYMPLCHQPKKSEKNVLAADKLLASVGHDSTPIDVIVQHSNLPIEQVLTRLLDLEVEGLIMAVPGGYLKLST